MVTRRTDIFATPGRFGWDGGYGTSAHLDPAEDMIMIYMVQNSMPLEPGAIANLAAGQRMGGRGVGASVAVLDPIGVGRLPGIALGR